jgi:hypothetical protein
LEWFLIRERREKKNAELEKIVPVESANWRFGRIVEGGLGDKLEDGNGMRAFLPWLLRKEYGSFKLSMAVSLWLVWL